MPYIQNVIRYHPLLCRQTIFKNKHQEWDAYVSTNPAVFISGRQITILVRHVNYRKFSDKTFALSMPKSNSKYSILSGILNIDSDGEKVLNTEQLESRDIICNYNCPTYDTYWTGPEDIRFIDEKRLMVTIPECNSNGQPCLFLANLDIKNATINIIQKLEPSQVEKNWMSFPPNGKNPITVIYSLEPFIIKSLEIDDKKTIESMPNIRFILSKYHGSSNGIKISNTKYLFLIHEYDLKTWHRWFIFDTESKQIQISDAFTFFQYSYIEFTCSLAQFNSSSVIVSLGVNDQQSYLVEISLKDILSATIN